MSQPVELCVVHVCVGLQVVDMAEMATEAVVDMVVELAAAGARVVVHTAMDMAPVCVSTFV